MSDQNGNSKPGHIGCIDGCLIGVLVAGGLMAATALFVNYTEFGQQAMWGRESPVSIKLPPFLLGGGNYVEIQNQTNDTLGDITVHYYSGNTKHTQRTGRSLGPHQSVTVDPSIEGITIRSDFIIGVTCKGAGRERRASASLFLR